MERVSYLMSKLWRSLTSWLMRRRILHRARELNHSGKMTRHISSNMDCLPIWWRTKSLLKSSMTKTGIKSLKLFQLKMQRNVTRDGCLFRNLEATRLNGPKKKMSFWRPSFRILVLETGLALLKSLMMLWQSIFKITKTPI